MQQDRKDSEVRLAMQQQFEMEGRELLLASARYGFVEAIMRLRALTEISEALSTDALFNVVLTIVDGEAAVDPGSRSLEPSSLAATPSAAGIERPDRAASTASSGRG